MSKRSSTSKNRKSTRNVSNESTSVVNGEYQLKDFNGRRDSLDGFHRQTQMPLLAEERQLKTMKSLPQVHNAYNQFDEDEDLFNDLDAVIGNYEQVDYRFSEGFDVISYRSHGDVNEHVLHQLDDVLPEMDPVFRFPRVSVYENNSLRMSTGISNQPSPPPKNTRNARTSLLERLERLRQRIPADLNHGVEELSADIDLFRAQLTSSDESSLRDMISNQDGGSHVLVRLLHKVQHKLDNDLLQQIRTQNALIELIELDILLSFQFLIQFEFVRQELLNDNVAIEVIIYSSSNHNASASNIAAVQIMTSLCDSPAACRVILDTLATESSPKSETGRFTSLVKTLNGCDDVMFMSCCMRLFNTLCRHTERRNRLSLQQEITTAGLDTEALRQFTWPENHLTNELEAQITEWNLQMQSTNTKLGRREEQTQLFGDDPYNNPRLSRHGDDPRNNPRLSRHGDDPEIKELRKEVNRLNDQLSEMNTSLEEWQQAGDKWTASATQWKTIEQELRQKCDEYKEMALQYRAASDKCRELYRDRMGRNPEEDPQYKDALYSPYVNNGLNIEEPEQERVRRQKYVTNDTLRETRPAVAVPMSHLGGTVRYKVSNHVNLPLLNWTPLGVTDSTMFQNLDIESVIRQLDFTEFDAQFGLRSSRPPIHELSGQQFDETDSALQLTFAPVIPRQPEKIQFVERNRAKNIAITQRKTNLSSLDLRRAIEQCDVVLLPGEYAELLLKFIPTKDEVKQLAGYDVIQVDNMAEAEQFIYHMSHIDRLESKLNVMTFMSQFSEIVKTLTPVIKRLHEASDSVCYSGKLRGVFEVILAFGNYMNTTRKGFILGFKLESLLKLSEVKSRVNRSVTLLHFIAQIITDHYLQLNNFYTELDVEINRSVSYQAITIGIQALRQGVDTAQYEYERQPDNETIASFVMTSSPIANRLLAEFHEMQDSYRTVCMMFAENFRLVEPRDIFGPIAAFVAAYKKAVDDNSRGDRSAESDTAFISFRRKLISTATRTGDDQHRQPEVIPVERTQPQLRRLEPPLVGANHVIILPLQTENMSAVDENIYNDVLPVEHVIGVATDDERLEPLRSSFSWEIENKFNTVPRQPRPTSLLSNDISDDNMIYDSLDDMTSSRYQGNDNVAIDTADDFLRHAQDEDGQDDLQQCDDVTYHNSRHDTDDVIGDEIEQRPVDAVYDDVTDEANFVSTDIDQLMLVGVPAEKSEVSHL